MQLIVRANVAPTDAPIPGERVLYHGSLDQVTEDVIATAATGADEVILHLHHSRSLDEALAAYARIAQAVGANAAGVKG
jgi:hypothetical protein